MDPLRMLAASSSPMQMLSMGSMGNGPGGRPSAPTLPPEQKTAMLAALQRQAGGALEVAQKVLDYPGAIGRGILAGDPLSGFSWDADRRVTGKELLEQYGLLNKNDNPYFSTFAGLAAEIATDPLSIISGPANALTKAGKAAQAAGILNHAQDAALAAMGIDKARDTLATGRSAYEFLGNLLPMGKAITKENAAYRPLVGPRVARSTTTLEEAIKHAPNPTEALDNVTKYLQKQGIDYDAVKGQNLGGALGINYFGLIDPIIFNPKTPGVQKALDYLDAGGQAVRWSAPVRGLSAVFDQRVGGRTSAYDQLMNLRHWDDLKAEQAAARVTGAKHAALVADTVLSDEAQRLLGAPTLNSEQGADFLTRLWENVPTQGDMRLRAAIGTDKTDELVKSWDAIRNQIRDDANSLGMVSRKLKTQYGGEWSPRSAREADFRDYGKGLSRQTFYARSLENEARKAYLDTPGVTVDLREISMLPKVKQFVQEGEKSGLSVADVGAEIKKFLDMKHGTGNTGAQQYIESLGLKYDPLVNPPKTFVPMTDAAGNIVQTPVLDAAGNVVQVPKLSRRGKPLIDKTTGQPIMVDKMETVYDPSQAITQRQAEKIARFQMRKDLSLADTTPMFSEHPLVSQSRAVMSQATARSNAREVYRSISEAAIHVGFGQHADTIKGTRFKPVDRALNEAARATGLKTSVKTGTASQSVQNILREQIAKINNIPVDQVKLSEWSIPEHVLERLTAVNDFYSRPRTQDAVMNMFGQIGQLYKGFLLAFPSRFTRDIYSNGYQLWTLAKNPADVVYGIKTAQQIVGGNTDAAAALLKELPGYERLTVQQARQKVLEDVSRTGILQTLASSDLLTSNRTGELTQLVPGIVPQKGLDFVKELIPDGSRSLPQMVSDYFTFKGTKVPFLQKQAAPETRNAILNASQKLNDYVDSVSRLGGMLALMRQGISADEAAKRVTEALVDYNSLTSVERNFFKAIFPWWSYSSRAGKYAVKQLVTNPGGPYAQTLRGFVRLQESDKDTYVPEALRQQFAVRVPRALEPFLRIPHNANTTTFLRDVDIPGHDVISLFSPHLDPYRAAQSTLYNLTMQSNPLIQGFVEQATGTDLFSRRPLRHSDSSLDRVYKTLTGSKTNMNPLARQALELIPAPRISGILGGLSDPRIPMDQRIMKTLVNSLTGVKLQTVDPAYQLSDARRILGGDLDAYMQDYTEQYIPEDVLPQVPSELLPKYHLFKALGKDLKTIRQNRTP